MTAFNNFHVASICCLSLRQNMNLRKSRFSSGQKRNSSCKDIKSFVRKERKPLKQSENAKCASKRLPKTPVKCQKLLIDDILLVSTPNINLVTSTPIPHEVRKRISRSSSRFNSDKITKLTSFNITSGSITSSPIRKNSTQIKPCEIKLIPVRPRGKIHSSERKSDCVSRNGKKQSNNEISHFSLNSPVETLKENPIVTRKSMTLRSQNISEKLPNNTKLLLSPKLKSSRKISVTSQKLLQKSKKSLEQLVASQNEVLPENKKRNVRKSSIPNNISSMLNKSNSNKKILTRKSFDKEISQASKDSLLQSYHETDSSKSSRYSLRKSNVSQNKSSKDSLLQSYHKTKSSKSSRYKLRKSNVSQNKLYCKKKSSVYSEKLVRSSTPKNLNSTLRKSTGVPRRSKNVRNTKGSQHSQISSEEYNNETGTSKSSRYSLRLHNQELSKIASGNGISFRNSLISQNIIKTPKCMLEPSSNTKRSSRHSLRLEKDQSSKKTMMTKSSSSQQFSKKTSNKKQKLAKNIHQNKISELCKKSSSSSKKQMSPKKSTVRKYFSLTETIPVDDLALSGKFGERRKVKSDGFKLPGKNTLKRKRCAIEAALKADEDYEDDLYESKKFDQFKVLLMDTSDSERSFAVSTPKFPVTPHIFHKTPKFKDCFSPEQYAISRKAAMEYMYRNRKRKSSQKPPETPVITEKKKLEYSEVLEDVMKIQKTIESSSQEESDSDSYFSLC